MNELIKFIGSIATIVAGITGLLVVIFTKFVPWLRNKYDRYSLKKKFTSELYSESEIESSIKYYIEPYCQTLDPSEGEEPRHILGIKQKIFEVIDEALLNSTEYRHIILLADSGMGKTTFLLNYYARHLKLHRNLFKIELLPLGIPDIDERIKKIQNSKDTVLFLDAFDEDTRAYNDHKQRLAELMNLTRNFKHVLITCRTHFFSKDEEIPKETGIVIIKPRHAGKKAQHIFHKIYLSPFTDKQIRTYLIHRYSFLHYRTRKKAMDLVKKIRHLCVRPMLLAYLPNLIGTERKIYYSYELYEDMIDAWLIREIGIIKGIEKELLRKFSEQLAVDLYVNRNTRGSERIPLKELSVLAQKWDIPLDEWKLTTRSLLNRDAEGNYKFAHRSIMEYLFVKKFIDGEKACKGRMWTEQMKMFYLEMLQNDPQLPFKIEGADLDNFSNVSDVKITPIYKLRTDAQKLDENDVKNILKKLNYFEKIFNKNGQGNFHIYVYREYQEDEVIIDYAYGKTWQLSGTENSVTFQDAQNYVNQLNSTKYAGYSNWRLPTIEEAMSLMEHEMKNGDLYINKIFDKTQKWIWTIDSKDYDSIWVVYFSNARCFHSHINNDFYVRAVC